MLGHLRKYTPPPNVLDCGNVSRICVQRRSLNARSPPIELAITTTAPAIQIYDFLFKWNTARYHADPKSVQSRSVPFEILSIAVTSKHTIESK